MLTITSQGSFVSDGVSRIIDVPQGVNWFKVYNYTNMNAPTLNRAFEFSWFTGMALNDGLYLYNSETAANDLIVMQDTSAHAVVPGFVLFNSTTQLPGAPIATTNSSNAAAPVEDTGNTLGLVINQTVIRMYGHTTAAVLDGIDFTVTNINAGVAFTLPTFQQAIPVDIGAASYRIISYDPSPEFYPTTRTIINITQAVNAVVTTSVVHQYTVGQQVRLVIPNANYGMVQANNLIVTVTVAAAATPNQFTCDLDTTGFTAFVWPLTLATRRQLPQVVPIGEQCALPAALSFLDATMNRGRFGMLLGAGALSPAGRNGDVIYWQGGTVENL